MDLLGGGGGDGCSALKFSKSSIVLLSADLSAPAVTGLDSLAASGGELDGVVGEVFGVDHPSEVGSFDVPMSSSCDDTSVEVDPAEELSSFSSVPELSSWIGRSLP